ncbi:MULTISPECIES: Lrp/AsnC family transcriptional regulator [Rhodopseudomonas]|uniref:AsnC family transcriptional regulator n=1 Tax=Rhodopseudomonas palustris TaxID=1076 RepID=A0A0D7ENK6_RHOPL|nr:MULTISPECIES: Lrp/AsnC family transcriptional regulator [Rhodopseudomonas]KIZ42414.1 AsnC family transcriptional regulator [Rhodopseudomonas palustris]MDF3810269.1 Lrp/AsnC family transcriptional regulator [Rhodopseudomonas sp. BAL398]WOK16052.1 Lrp/AsnC family transcriptional regulator [Rhodopseudomonas sp. BAL398]
MSDAAKTTLDRIDRKILQALQQDARLPNVALAERVGLSPSPCLRRVKLLEAGGAIEGYRTVLDRQAIGLGLTVFAGVRVDRHSRHNEEAFVTAVLAMPEVVGCHLVSGEADFLVEIVVPDMATYESTVLRRFLSLPTVRDIRSSFAMRSYRANGALPINAD